MAMEPIHERSQQVKGVRRDNSCALTNRNFFATIEIIVSEPHRPQPVTRAELMAFLIQLGIETTTTEHPAFFTVAESAVFANAGSGGHTKNLFLKDAKGALWLVIAYAHSVIDLNRLSKRLGCARFSFGKPELLMERLGVPPWLGDGFCAYQRPAAAGDCDHRRGSNGVRYHLLPSTRKHGINCKSTEMI